MARYYVSKNAIRDLNVDKRTTLLDKDGNEVDAYIVIRDGRPRVYNILGCGDSIYLSSLKLLLEDKLEGVIITKGVPQYIHFYILDNEPEYKTEW